MNLRVNLTKRVRTADGLRYCPVVESRNGRIRPDAVMVNGQEERHTEGAYYIEWREDGQRTLEDKNILEMQMKRNFGEVARAGAALQRRVLRVRDVRAD